MKKKRILVIDDEAAFTRLLSLNLAHQYQVRVENEAPKALTAALEFKPDLILLDVMMPGADGGELAGIFQAHPQLKHLPIVFLTAAVARKEVRSNEGMIGGLPFMAKPASVQEIRDCVEKYLA
jgi:CheY-like chemotaxis protein